MVARVNSLPAASTVFVVLLFTTMLFQPVLGESGPGSEQDGEEVPKAVLRGEGLEPVVTPYYVMATSGAAIARGTLSPAALELNDTMAEITVPGPTFPRYTLTRAGSFTMQISLHMELRVYGVSLVSVWAKSDEGAQNARFRVLFQRNGGTQNYLNTNTAQLTNVPMEFTVADPPTFTEPMVFRSGDTLGIEIQYTASSRYFVGPAPSCTLLANSVATATRIELLTVPLDMNVTAPTFQEKKIHLNGKVWDTSEVDPMSDLHVTLEVVPGGGGTVDASTIQRMNFNPRESEIVVNWTWDYKKGKNQLTDGLYEFRIDVSYGVAGKNYTNSTFYELEFPRKEREGGALTALQMSLLALGIIIILGAVAFILMRRRRQVHPRRAPRGRALPPLPKRVRGRPPAKGRKGSPPPGRQRTPMPGKAPPDARRPPKRAPPTGSARPRQ